jgi:hypothetical protein
MKIDMSKKAITNRLKIVNQLRNVCLSLANSSAGVKIRKKPPTSSMQGGLAQHNPPELNDPTIGELRTYVLTCTIRHGR